MSDLLLDLINHLASKGIVEGDGIDSFRDFTPEEPESVYVMHEYAGAPTPLHDTFTHRSIQLTFGDKGTSVAKAKCKQIIDDLSPVEGYMVLSNGRVCQIYPRQ